METTFNLKNTIDSIVKEKGIDKQVVLEALEQAVLSAANKKYRNTRDLEAHFNEEAGEVELFEFVTVVEEVTDSYKEIDLEEAREVDPDVEIGDSLGMKMDASDFTRIAAQTAKQVIIQKVREAERETIYNEFISRFYRRTRIHLGYAKMLWRSPHSISVFMRNLPDIMRFEMKQKW